MFVELSIVLLCYRSEDLLYNFTKQIIEELEHENISSYEIVLVANYDSAKDKTPEIARKISSEYEKVRVLSNQKEGRMGWDMRSGLEEAKGKYICVLDGDGQMPTSDIGTVYNIIKTGKYDLVKTFRVYRYDGFYRKILSHIYNLLFVILFRPNFPINDINSKPKIFTNEAYKKLNLKSNDWFTDAEIIIQAIENNFKICQISTVFYKNERRKSFVGFKTIWEFIYNLIYYKLKK